MNKKIVGFLCLLFMVNISFAQKEKIQAYINQYKDISVKEMKRTGVPAAITLAQAIIESGFGESVLSLKSNNHFGIKCKSDWTGEKVYHDDDESQECFRKYNTVEESFVDHSDFLKNRPYYVSLFSLNPTDMEAWAKGLKQCGYATEKDYPEKLLKVIYEYNLSQYNYSITDSSPAIEPIKKTEVLPVEAKQPPIVKTTEPIVNQPATTVTNKKHKPQTTVVNDEADVDAEQPIKTAVISDADKNIKPKYPAGLFTINGSKVMLVTEGTSLLSIAHNFKLTLAKLIDYNDLPETIEILEKDQLIFLERKAKKGSTDWYVVEPNENLHDISQKLGIQLQQLANYNAISVNLNPLVGEKLYLRAKTPVAPKVTMANPAITMQ